MWLLETTNVGNNNFLSSDSKSYIVQRLSYPSGNHYMYVYTALVPLPMLHLLGVVATI